MRRVRLKAFDPETGELEDGEIQIPGGFLYWSPAQWAMFLAALLTFVAGVANVLGGNPVGIPGAG